MQVCKTGSVELRREEPQQIWSSMPTLLTWTQMPALLSCLLASQLAQAGQSLRQCLLRTGELPVACQLSAKDVTQSEDSQPHHPMAGKDAWPPACLTQLPCCAGQALIA